MRHKRTIAAIVVVGAALLLTGCPQDLGGGSPGLLVGTSYRFYTPKYSQSGGELLEVGTVVRIDGSWVLLDDGTWINTLQAWKIVASPE